MTEPLVSIIIVNYNGQDLLDECLGSLSNVDYPNIETILVDNNSTDDSIEFITSNYPAVIVLKLDSNKGFAEPNNLGAKIAKGKYLLFLNNDTIVTKNFVGEMVQEIEKDEQIAICQSMLLKPNGTVDSSGDYIDDLGVVYSSKTRVTDVRNITSARGASMLIRKNVFEKLGGFDEKFFVSFEDVDLGWRAWISGYRSILVPSSIVYHLGGSTIKKLQSEIAFHGFKNQLIMKITNFESNLVFKKMTRFFLEYGFREIRIWLDYTFKGHTKLSSTKYENNMAPKPQFKIILKSIFWILRNRRYLRAKQQSINSMRIISTETLKNNSILCTKPR